MICIIIDLKIPTNLTLPFYVIIHAACIDPIENKGETINGHTHGDGWHKIADWRRTGAFYGQGLVRCVKGETAIDDALSCKVTL